MKARRVRRLDRQAPLADNAERIVRVRLDELYGFIPAALNVKNVVALHDMRIAAKRLRYLLEVTGFCFGPYASTATKRAKELQDLLGEIHDCDVMLPLVDSHRRGLRSEDVAALLLLAGEADDLDPQIASQAPNAAAYQGLDVLELYLQTRRDLLFERFLALWQSYERQAFRARLEWAVGERASSQDGDVDLQATSPLMPASLSLDPGTTMTVAAFIPTSDPK